MSLSYLESCIRALFLLWNITSTHTNTLTYWLRLIYSPDSGYASTVVSPEQSVAGGGDNGAAQARQIITQHAAATIEPMNGNPQQPHVVYASYNQSQPSGHPIPQIATHGISIPTPIPQYVSQVATGQNQAMLAQSGGITSSMLQQPGVVVTKRRRTNPSNVAAGIPASLATAPILADPAAVAAALAGRGRRKSQAQIDRRRERNRILARRTRLRKKFFFESLQKEVMDLQRENGALKDIVRSHVDSDEGRQLLEECNANEKVSPIVLEACGELGADLDQQDFNLIKSIQQSQHSFIITDPSLHDNPIVFASDDFLSLTGYAREDVLGRNCRFLQGTDTSQEKVDAIRKGLASGDDVSVTMVNYTADGVPFWNKLFIASLRDSQNNIVNFIGVVVKVASPDPDDPEFGKRVAAEEDDDDDDDFDYLQDDAEGTVRAIESAVTAAVASAPSAYTG
jgi:PAS domain S-box-containing protein